MSMEEPPDRSWLDDMTTPIPKRGKDSLGFDRYETLETPEAFSSRWSKKLALATMIVVASGAAIIFLAVIVRVARAVAGL